MLSYKKEYICCLFQQSPQMLGYPNQKQETQNSVQFTNAPLAEWLRRLSAKQDLLSVRFRHGVPNKCEAVMWHKSTGIIQYDPPRGGMKKRTKWWAVVHVNKEITRYYRWWVKSRYWVDLYKPSWDAHISIIRGEEPEEHLKHLWKKYDGHRVEFEYSHNVRRSGDTTGWDRPDNYWFVEVKCPFLIDIRRELNRPTHWNLHLTIGRTYY